MISLGIPAGQKGDPGDPGQTPNITIGTVETLPAGSSVTASISGQTPNLVLNLGIPQGQQGDPGEAATVTVGTTTTGAPGSQASVVNSGTPNAAVLDFTIPAGETGAGLPPTDTAQKGDVVTYDGEKAVWEPPAGGGDNWELIYQHTVTADEEENPPAWWVVSADQSGSPVELKKIAFKANVITAGSGGSTQFIFRISPDANVNTNYIIFEPYFQNGSILILADGGDINGYPYCIALSSVNPQYNYVTPDIKWKAGSQAEYPFKGANWKPYNAADFFAQGTTFELWGVKA